MKMDREAVITNFIVQQDIAEHKFAEQYLKVKEFLETHSNSFIFQDNIQIHPDDKEDFMKVMYGDIMI